MVVIPAEPFNPAGRVAAEACGVNKWLMSSGRAFLLRTSDGEDGRVAAAGVGSSSSYVVG